MGGVVDELAAKIAAFLVEHPGEHGLDDIAKGIRARRVVVQQAVESDARFQSREIPGKRGRRRQVWRIASTPVTMLGQLSSARLTRRGSQCARLMVILQDGEWHTSQELNRRVKCVVHSRIDELRDRGKRSGLYRLEHDGVGAGPEFHKYRVIWLQQPATAPLKAAA